MRKNIQSVRGMNDYLFRDTPIWQTIEKKLKKTLYSYGYNEIRLPIIEKTSLFHKAIGNVTDVVEKEMYSFLDRNGESITLRPEGTAGCIRSGIENNFIYNQEQRLWYIGPMFRYERPQKGRYRQFYQMGAEVFGQKGPDIDAELILLASRCWRELGINKYVNLEINSIGSLETRRRYSEALVKFLKNNLNYLDEDCIRRMHTNPIRILDTKNPDIKMLLNKAPVITNYLDNDSYNHFYNLCKLLDLMGCSYKVNPYLVRGLDYYTGTVFEYITTYLGSQGTICGGGRYDALVEKLGGGVTPAIGFSIGLERLVMLVKKVNPNLISYPLLRIDVYLVSVGLQAQISAIQLAEECRNALPSLHLITNYGGGNFKKQLRRANKHNAHIALILGEKEIKLNKVLLKNLITFRQEILERHNVIDRLISILGLHR